MNGKKNKRKVDSHSPSICSLTMTISTFWWRALIPGLLLITATLPNRSSSFLNCIDIDSRSPDLECSVNVVQISNHMSSPVSIKMIH